MKQDGTSAAFSSVPEYLNIKMLMNSILTLLFTLCTQHE